MKYPVTLLAALLAATLGSASPVQNIASDSPVSYDGFRIYSIPASNSSELLTLLDRFSHFHTERVHNSVSVAVPPTAVSEFEAEMSGQAQLLNEDLGAMIREEAGGVSVFAEAGSTYESPRAGQLPDIKWFESYHSYADHLRFWDDLIAAFPQNMKKMEIGMSFEKKPMFGFSLSGKNPGGNKPIILYHGSVHAREWISAMTLEYVIYQLISGYKSGNKEAVDALDTYDFFMVPFHNPDGFVYTQTKDRMWRKSRQTRPNIKEVGTDLNRNWKTGWDADGGSSTQPGSETFRGLAPGDTPENKALDGFSARITENGKRKIRAFIDWHSFGQYILTPYGYTCTELPPTNDRQQQVAHGVGAAIAKASTRGSKFTIGPACKTLYQSAGNSRDHMSVAYKADHSWTLELSPDHKDGGGGGFVLPPAMIMPVVKEQWAGQMWLYANVKNN